MSKKGEVKLGWYTFWIMVISILTGFIGLGIFCLFKGHKWLWKKCQ